MSQLIRYEHGRAAELGKLLFLFQNKLLLFQGPGNGHVNQLVAVLLHDGLPVLAVVQIDQQPFVVQGPTRTQNT